MKAYRFSLILLSSIVLGAFIGVWLGKDAVILKPLGDIFLNLLFTLVVPLVFFTISSAIAQMGELKRLGRILSRMFGTFVFTGVIAAMVMLVAVLVFPPAEGVSISLEKPEQMEQTTLADQLVKTITVEDFSQLFIKDHMLQLIFFAIFLGIAVSLLGEKSKPFARFLYSGSEVFMKLVTFVMYYAPIGLGAFFAALVGEFGPSLLTNYFRVVLLYYPLSLVYYLVFFTLYAFLAGKGAGARVFWKNALSPTVVSLATCSSAASIPVNLEATRKMGVPHDISETSVPLGANIHKDGSVMGGILKIAFLFGIFGMDFTQPIDLISALGVAILVGTVMGAIPSGGLIGEMLILSVYGFPPEALPIIAAISAIIDPPATMINSTGNTVTSMMIARWVEGRKWLSGKFGKTAV
ncbi:dicarboxylate/amino acid:cation symporter [Thermoactinomyces mirandus]|uniref:Dicarboxylate/amino acid:cation symporter n=1 Tax=Thermoactinomyces mirandus TaxID=2756294 RepID=A0A7W2AS32_9BACL|nr:dicarboxylate/amino acid:cation symporter [Thermoactinomyces mirandus]MBA4603022.1 dicarboxylate/amino acid:cation symporter [Thermoactinomyces mirandus]